jgi:transcriptional regulator with XRE-family HTH domain
MLAAEILKQARGDAGLTLRELAERASTSHSALSAYESANKRPSTRTFFRIIDAAGFAVDFELAPRRRGERGLPRGEELRQVLELAEQFPARHESALAYPSFAAGARPL